MKSDEFAFFNQQLAAMLRDGIPLEGALKKLCAEMRQGAVQVELQHLQADLASGTPLGEAIRKRQLPELYQNLIEVGAQSRNLPGVLTLIADYYQRKHNLWTRLKGLLVYPMMVLGAAFLLSCFLTYVLNFLVWPNLAEISAGQVPPGVMATMWLSPIVLGITAAAALLGLTTPELRRWLRWRVPAFRESSLSEVAGTLGLLLRAGVPLDRALGLVARLEANTRAGAELAEWQRRLAAGHGKFQDLAQPGPAFPPLFVWLVAQSREDLAGGFEQAAELYQSRSGYRREVLLFSALPCSVLALGLMLVIQVQPVFATLVQFMNMIGGETGSL